MQFSKKRIVLFDYHDYSPDLALGDFISFPITKSILVLSELEMWISEITNGEGVVLLWSIQDQVGEKKIQCKFS